MEQKQTTLLIPGLRPFYEWSEPVSWLLVRLTVGLMIIPHGWPKVIAGIGPTAANALAKRGIEPAEPLAVILIILETLGGLCVALGLFTRFFKFGWTGPGYEYPLMWGLAMLAIALRGGGPYSLDRRLGREL